MNIPDDIDEMIYCGKQHSEQSIDTSHFGSVTVRSVIEEKLDTPSDKQFKFNPEMRINR